MPLCFMQRLVREPYILTAIAALVGMAAEARLLALPLACSGGDAARAETLALQLLEQGAEALLSFGIAGGLTEASPGQLVIGSGVAVDGRLYPCDPAVLQAALPQARVGVVAGAAAAVITVADKQALHQLTGALCVDLESAAVARACAAYGRPFLVLRAIADPVERAIPPLALAGLDAQGGMRPGRVALGVLTRPTVLPALLRLGLDSRAALRSLAGAAVTLGFQTP